MKPEEILNEAFLKQFQ